MRGQLMPSELENAALPGGFRIVKRQRTERGATERVTIGAKVVPSGTYERKQRWVPPTRFVAQGA